MNGRDGGDVVLVRSGRGGVERRFAVCGRQRVRGGSEGDGWSGLGCS